MWIVESLLLHVLLGEVVEDFVKTVNLGKQEIKGSGLYQVTSVLQNLANGFSTSQDFLFVFVIVLIYFLSTKQTVVESKLLLFAQIFSPNGEAQVLDCRDESHSNWLMFVKRARYAQEQNLVVYQKDDNIFFITSKDIYPDTELLYWYARDYATLVGKDSSV